jgi:hypothetical protein
MPVNSYKKYKYMLFSSTTNFYWYSKNDNRGCNLLLVIKSNLLD